MSSVKHLVQSLFASGRREDASLAQAISQLEDRLNEIASGGITVESTDTTGTSSGGDSPGEVGQVTASILTTEVDATMRHTVTVTAPSDDNFSGVIAFVQGPNSGEDVGGQIKFAGFFPMSPSEMRNVEITYPGPTFDFLDPLPSPRTLTYVIYFLSVTRGWINDFIPVTALSPQAPSSPTSFVVYSAGFDPYYEKLFGDDAGDLGDATIATSNVTFSEEGGAFIEIYYEPPNLTVGGGDPNLGSFKGVQLWSNSSWDEGNVFSREFIYEGTHTAPSALQRQGYCSLRLPAPPPEALPAKVVVQIPSFSEERRKTPQKINWVGGVPNNVPPGWGAVINIGAGDLDPSGGLPLNFSITLIDYIKDANGNLKAALECYFEPLPDVDDARYELWAVKKATTPTASEYVKLEIQPTPFGFDFTGDVPAGGEPETWWFMLVFGPRNSNDTPTTVPSGRFPVDSVVLPVPGLANQVTLFQMFCETRQNESVPEGRWSWTFLNINNPNFKYARIYRRAYAQDGMTPLEEWPDLDKPYFQTTLSDKSVWFRLPDADEKQKFRIVSYNDLDEPNLENIPETGIVVTPATVGTRARYFMPEAFGPNSGIVLDVDGTIQQINAQYLAGSITADQIESINAGSIVGSIAAERINHVRVDQFTGSLSTQQAQAININSFEGAIVSSKLADQVLNDARLFSQNMRPVRIVTSLPLPSDTAYVTGDIITFQGKNYRRRSDGTWDSSVDGGDIVGTISEERIGSINANKLYGAIAAGLITHVRVDQFAGTLSATQMGQLNINNFAGTLNADRIDQANINLNSLNGTLSAAKIDQANININNLNGKATFEGNLSITVSQLNGTISATGNVVVHATTVQSSETIPFPGAWIAGDVTIGNNGDLFVDNGSITVDGQLTCQTFSCSASSTAGITINESVWRSKLNVYTQTQVDNLLSAKASSTHVHTITLSKTTQQITDINNQVVDVVTDVSVSNVSGPV